MCYTNKVCQDLSVKRKEVILLKKTKDEIRRDSKGRRLKDGEGQRKDGLYYYRYHDISGERRYVYDRDLDELRKKKKTIELQLAQGISYFDGSVPLSELIDKLFILKPKWRDSTKLTMERYANIIKKSKLYHMPANKIKMVDCKTYMVELHDEGYAYGTIASIHTILKESFDIACESDALLKNPCKFMLKSIVEDDTEEKVALTEEQEKSLFEFLRTDTLGRRHLNMFTILLGTGMRISEFAALTLRDIDFANNLIHVNKQTSRIVGAVKITPPKSKKGIRDIPMNEEVRKAVCELIDKRKNVKLDVMVDGHVGFLSVTRNGRPRTHSEYADAMRNVMERYNEKCEIKIEHCTPHTLRHTFSTKLIAKGRDVKSVQYLLGHSDAQTTLNVYTDPVESNIVESIKAIKIG